MQSERQARERSLDEVGLPHNADVLRKVTERFPGMLAVVGSDGQGMYFNPSLLAYFGMRSEGVNGNRWFSYLHEDDRIPFLRSWHRARRSREAFRAEVRILHPEEKRHRLYLTHGVPLEASGGSPDPWVVTCTDVHDLRETQAALEDTTAHLRTVFEASTSSLCLCSLDGTVIAANPMAVKRIRWLYGSELSIGDKLWDALPAEGGSKVADGFRQALTGQHWESEDVTYGPDGRSHWFHMSYVPVRPRSQITGVLLSAFDITDRKQAEEAKLEHEMSIRINRERVEMSLRQMAHELEERVAEQTEELRREIAERKSVEADLVVLRQKVVEHGERERAALAADLHDDVLQEVLGMHMTMSNMVRNSSEAVGAPRLREEMSHTLAGLRRIANSLRRTIRGLKPTALDELGLRSALESFVDGIEVSDKPDIVLNCDECDDLDHGLQLCLYRVGHESIRNAVKHAGADRIVASLRRRRGEVVLHVADDGAGFEIPSRISSLVRDDHFGLAGIAEHVVAWGGELDVRSGVDQGTVVEARFPLAESSSSQ